MKMNLRKRLSLLLIALSMAAAMAAAQTGKVADLTPQASSVTDFEVNGLKVILKRRASAPTVAAALFFRGGAKNLPGKPAGIENLMLNAATEASKSFPRQVLRREIANTGSSLGASASDDFSVVSLASTRENFDRMWKIFTDVTLSPS